jgi:putative glutathione S-transferase
VGLLVDGVWFDQWYDTKSTGGRFVRQVSTFRNWVTPDGAPGPTGAGGFKAEPGRYHLYVSLACPWAHRTLIFRKLKRLEPMIALSVVHWLMEKDGWTFAEAPGVVPDPIHGARFLHEIYTRAQPDYTGRVTVPVLWDKATNTIVNNESSEIIRMFNSAFDACGAAPGDFCPEELRPEIDGWNARIYDTVNNGVYRAGFATSQEAYEEAFVKLFETLDMLDEHLGRHRYLTGHRLTEADWRLFTTLLRFDVVYVGHFKCNLRRIADYPNLSGYLRDLYQVPGVADTVDMRHIKGHYYQSHRTINPTGIVAAGPLMDLHIDENIVVFAVVKATQPGTNNSWPANLAMNPLIAGDLRHVDHHLCLSRCGPKKHENENVQTDTHGSAPLTMLQPDCSYVVDWLIVPPRPRCVVEQSVKVELVINLKTAKALRARQRGDRINNLMSAFGVKADMGFARSRFRGRYWG